MDAKELRKKLDEGLKPDTSGKTTPIQRLTPFLQALTDYLEQQENKIGLFIEDGKRYLDGVTAGNSEEIQTKFTSSSESSSKP